MRLRAAGVLLVLAATPAAAFTSRDLLINRLDPSVEYRTRTTPHFEIHYAVQFESTAERVAAAAERVHEKTAAYFGWTPNGRTNIVLVNQSDLGRVYSFVHPHRQIFFDFALPPPSLGINDYGEWIEWLLTHEYTHIIQLEMRRGVYRGLTRALGGWIQPHMAAPLWLKEGLAVYMETSMTPKGRGGSSGYRMLTRMAVAEGLLDDPEFVSKDRISNIESKSWPWTFRPYVFGWHMVKTLAAKDEGALNRFLWTAAESAPYDLGPAYRAAGAGSFDELWDKTMAEIRREGRAELEALEKEPRTRLEYLTNSGHLKSGLTMAPDGGSLVFSRDDPDHENAIIQLPLDEDKVGAPKELVLRSTGEQSSFSRSSRFLVFDQAARSKRHYVISDLYIRDLKTNTFVSVSPYFRARDADVHPDGKHIVFVVNEGGRNRLIMTDTNWGRGVDLLGDLGGRRLSGPRFSPDGNTIALSVHHDETGGEELWLVSADGAREVALGGAAQHRGVSWTPDGSALLFSSDMSGVFNAYALDLRTRRLSRMTHVLGGVFSPVVDPQLRWVYAISYRGRGYDVARFRWDPASWIEVPKPAAAKVPRQSAAALPAVAPAGETREYRGTRSLAPQFLTPAFGWEPRTTRAGFITGATDPLFFQSWQLKLLYDSAARLPVGSFSYFNGTMPWAFEVNAAREAAYIGGEGRTLESVSGEAAAIIPLGREGSILSLRPGFSARSVDFKGKTFYMGPSVGLRRDTEFKQIGHSFPESGSYFDFAARRYVTGLSATALSVVARSHVPLDFRRHAVHFSLEGAAFTGSRSANAIFHAGGTASSVQYPAETLSFVGSPIVLHGYAPNAFVSRALAVGGAQYTFPIRDIQRGTVSPPAVLGRLSGGVRLQAAAVEDLRPSGTPWSAGVELHQEFLLGHVFPFNARLGLYRGAPKWGGRTQLIFSLSESF